MIEAVEAGSSRRGAAARFGVAADIQDRDGAPVVLKFIRHAYPLASACVRGRRVCRVELRGTLDRICDGTLQIVKRSDTANGFEAFPRRWVVARIFAWLGRCRRLGKNWEKSIASAKA